MPCPLRVGLTGGIGSGKSAAAREFERLGAAVIDTDLIARELVEPDQPALAEIVARFGADLLDAEGRLRRDRLRALVFSDQRRLRQLEDILHPRIRERALELAEQAQSPYCVLVVPLLVETGDDYRLDRVLLIDCPEPLQRERIQARDRLSDSEIDAILATQATRAQRRARADDIVVNDQQLEHLHAVLKDLHRQYLKLAGASRNRP